MNPMRGLLLAGSRNEWLCRQATRRTFVRRAVSRFMPGESADEALAAAEILRGGGFGVILTNLGENVSTRSEAQSVAGHYLDLIRRLQGTNLDAEISVKLTQLGLDLDQGLAEDHLDQVAGAARAAGIRVWVDMESSAYTQVTVDVYRRALARHRGLGIALQTYLRRTAADVETLLAEGAAIRLVKGAYDEPQAIAFGDKAEVDASFLRLAGRLLDPDARAAGAWLTVGSHDPALIRAIEADSAQRGVGRREFEFALLYGIGRSEQQRLVRVGARVRVLISYGAFWFPWYMRRLAERPANVLFVLRSMVNG